MLPSRRLSRYCSCSTSSGLLSLTGVCLMGRLPTTAPAVNTQSRDYESLRRRFALTARDDFVHKLHSFSRVNFDPQQRPQVHAYLSEALQERRMADLPAKTVHDMTHLAFVAGLHELCLALYHAKRQQDARRRGGGGESLGEALADGVAVATPSKKVVNNFLVSQYIVDSAYATENVVELLRIASYCTRCAREDRATGASSPEVMTTFSLFRCLWRVVCLSEHFLRGEVSGTHSAGGTSAEALEAARLMLTDYILPFVEATRGTGQRHAGSVHAAVKGQLTEGSVDWFLRAVQRVVKYDTSGDDGEMFFYRHCLRTGCLVAPLPSNGGQGTNTNERRETAEDMTAFSESRVDVDSTDLRESQAILTASVGGSLMHYVNETELFYAALIDTCATGRHVEAAMHYYDEARRCCLGPSALSVAVSPPPLDGGEIGSSSPSSPPPQDHQQQPAMSEYVLYRLLAVPSQRRDNKRIVKLARTLLADQQGNDSPPPIGISVWSVFLISAGEARAADVALAAYAYAQDRVRKSSPSTNERRGFEYLLQTSLHALSKCQMTDFEENYLIPIQEAGLLHCTQEFYYCCLLQDAHNSLNPAERAAAIVARMESDGVDRSVAIASRLLKLYLRCESPLLLPTYQQAVRDHGLARRAWLDELVVWADRRRYFLSQEDRAFILDEVAALSRRDSDGSGGDDRTSFMGGLRTQLALLEYDYAEQPQAYFLSHGMPPPTEPTVMDSRAHFLLRRPHRVLQGISARGRSRHPQQQHRPAARAGGDGPSMGFQPPAASAVLGDPTRLATLARKVAFAGVTPLMLSRPSRAASLQSESASRSANAAGSVHHPQQMTSHTEAQWEDEATRLYLVEMLEGLQRSRNHIS